MGHPAPFLGTLGNADVRVRVTFGDLALHYQQHELGEQTETVAPKAHTTIGGRASPPVGQWLVQDGRGRPSSIAPAVATTLSSQAGQLKTTLFCINGAFVPLAVCGVATRCPCGSKRVV